MLPRIRLAALMEMPENKFAELVRGIERNDLFRKLLSCAGTSRRVISYRRFSGVGLARSFFELRDEMIRDAGGLDVETLFSARQDVLSLIQAIGMDAFEELFLRNEVELSAAAVGARCGLSIGQVEKINALMNEISVHSEFYHPSTLPSTAALRYHKVAVIDADSAGCLTARFFSPKFISGRYVVDVAAIGRLKREGFFSAHELKDLDKLLRDIELINDRKSTLYHVVVMLLRKQAKYILSGDRNDLVSYTQRDLARESGIDTSLVCRAIQSRSIELPHGAEVPLKDLFVSRKYIIARLIGDIIRGSDAPLTDQRIQRCLREQFGFAISRRTVNAYKKISRG